MVMAFDQFPRWCSRALGSLDHCSNGQLADLLESNVQLEQFIDDLPEVHELKRQRQSLHAEVFGLAQTNLDKEPILEEKKGRYITACDTLRQVKGVYDNDKAQLELYAQGLSPEHNQRALQDLATTTEEETEAMAQRFLDGKFDTEKFVEEFIRKRSKSHVLRIKSEKMADLLASSGHAAGMPSPFHQPPTIPVGYAGPFSLPGPGHYGH